MIFHGDLWSKGVAVAFWSKGMAVAATSRESGAHDRMSPEGN